MKKIFIILLFGIFLINSISAITISLSANPSELTLNLGSSSQITVSYVIDNSGGLTGQKGVNILGSPKILSYSGSSVSYAENTTTSGSIILNANANVSGDFVNYVQIGEQSLAIPIHINNPPQQQSNILVFPTSKVVTVKQGEEKVQNILITVPSTYLGTITIQSVDFNPGTENIKFGDLNLGLINPGSTIQIPIIFSGVDASTGTYQTNLDIFAINSSGKIPIPIVNLQLQVVQGIQPITNFSLNDLPVCSVSAIELSLNNSQKLTCSFSNPNINIHPLIDSKYLKGMSVSETASQYIYEFQPILIGQTTIGAEFLYKNAPLGSVYQQDIRISASGGTPVSGITTNFIFYQNGIKRNIADLMSGETIIQIIDNRTGNILSNYKFYVNGLETNSTINLIQEKNYELRSSVPGYIDNVINFSVQRVPLIISIQPSKSWYFTGEMINITSVNGTSFTANDVIINSPYTLIGEGNIIIKAYKDGYENSNLTLDVRNQVTWTSMSPLIDKWRKGKSVVIDLNKNTSWNVEFKESYKENNFVNYREPVIVSSGEGSRIQFKIDKYGQYEIKSGEMSILQKTVEKGTLFSWLPDWEWYYYAGIVFVIIMLIYVFKKKEENITPYS